LARWLASTENPMPTFLASRQLRNDNTSLMETGTSVYRQSFLLLSRQQRVRTRASHTQHYPNTMVTYFRPESEDKCRPRSSTIQTLDEQDGEHPRQLQAVLEERQTSSHLSDCIGCGSNDNNASTVNDAFTMRNWSFFGSYTKDDLADEEYHHTQGASHLSRNSSSLAKMDSLALEDQHPDADDTFVIDPNESIIVEHEISDYSKSSRRQRKIFLITACCLMLGVVVLTTTLAMYLDDGSLRSRDVAVNDGSNVESSVSDNIFNPDELPDVYYILEPKVGNASALLDHSTVEGKAFDSIVKQVDLISYNDAAGDNAKNLDLVQRYALMTMYFGADGDGWNIKDGWTEESDVCVRWHGVECKDSVVTRVKLGE
jgi:hypothetical protein